MDNLVDRLASQITPAVAARLGRLFGVDRAAVEKAIRVLGSLAIAALARRATTPHGAAAVLASLPKKEEPGLLASLAAAFKGDVPSETPADRMQAIFGGGVNSMVSALSRQLGFDLGPLAGMLAPLIGQELASAVKKEALDPAGFANLLRYSGDEFLAAPENSGIAALVADTLAIGDRAEALRERFTADELEEIHTAPMAAYAIIAKSSISGIRSSLAEIKAAHRVGLELLREVEPTSLLGSVFGAGLTSSEAAEMKREMSDDRQLIETIRGAAAIVAAKAPDEAAAFRKLVAEVAEKVAAAGKEGGFLGFGATRVSEAESAALRQIREALG
jgi:hypothetical protein